MYSEYIITRIIIGQVHCPFISHLCISLCMKSCVPTFCRGDSSLGGARGPSRAFVADFVHQGRQKTPTASQPSRCSTQGIIAYVAYRCLCCVSLPCCVSLLCCYSYLHTCTSCFVCVAAAVHTSTAPPPLTTPQSTTHNQNSTLPSTDGCPKQHLAIPSCLPPRPRPPPTHSPRRPPPWPAG